MIPLSFHTLYVLSKRRELTLSREEFKAQLIEMERLEKLKAEQEKSERGIKKLFNPATLKAQAQKWKDREAKKTKSIEEINQLISFRADPLPITRSATL
ncbi:hypothetical protein Tco_1100637 [Tanacetum coccineum]